MVILGTIFPVYGPSLQESVAMACDNIQRMRADMGGTNILSPLKWIIRQPVHRGHPRLLFLITDGAVNNTGKVLELVRNHAFSTRWAQAEGLGLWLSWAAVGCPGLGCQKWGILENVRRKGETSNPAVLCFEGGAADFKICLLPSKFRWDEITTPLHLAPKGQPRWRKYFLLL